MCAAPGEVAAHTTQKREGRGVSWTLNEARGFLQTWLEAEQAVAVAGKSYRIGTRELMRADLRDIKERISYWRSEIARLEAGRTVGARVMRFVPRDN
jgi:uncharacterized small protein (DUF1192 family)